jgi:hypothetical protein
MRRSRLAAPRPRPVALIEVPQRSVAIVDDDQAARDSLHFLLEVVGHPVKVGSRIPVC